MRSSTDVLFAAYRDVLIRIREQAENFDRSEAIDILGRIVESSDVTQEQRYEMMATVIRAAESFELDDNAEHELRITEEWLGER